MSIDKIGKAFGAYFVGIILLNLAVLGFIGWVVVKLLQHFQVI